MGILILNMYLQHFPGLFALNLTNENLDIARTVTEYQAYPHVAELTKTKLDLH